MEITNLKVRILTFTLLAMNLDTKLSLVVFPSGICSLAGFYLKVTNVRFEMSRDQTGAGLYCGDRMSTLPISVPLVSWYISYSIYSAPGLDISVVLRIKFIPANVPVWFYVNPNSMLLKRTIFSWYPTKFTFFMKNYMRREVFINEGFKIGYRINLDAVLLPAIDSPYRHDGTLYPFIMYQDPKIPWQFTENTWW